MYIFINAAIIVQNVCQQLYRLVTKLITTMTAELAQAQFKQLTDLIIVRIHTILTFTYIKKYKQFFGSNLLSAGIDRDIRAASCDTIDTVKVVGRAKTSLSRTRNLIRTTKELRRSLPG